MKKYWLLFLAGAVFFGTYFYFQIEEKQNNKNVVDLGTISYGSTGIGAPKNTQGRVEWEVERLRDPKTGRIPNNIRRRELEYKRKYLKSYIRNSKSSTWVNRGPYNVGGRTRTMALDVRNENTIWLGAVSGGIWRSEDAGDSWEKISSSTQIQNVTTLVQDTRPGKEDTWYYGTGEALGNSASAPGAFYLGNGVYKTINNGMSWVSLGATSSNTPERFDSNWDLIYRVAIDPSDTINDIVYAASLGTISRSTDGGRGWQTELGGTASTSTQATDVLVTSNGVVYATLSSNSQDNGIWRSTDGQNWTNIIDTGFASVYNRIVMAVNPSNENELYFLATTPGFGQMSTTFLDEEEYNSLWKYEYVSGNGSDTGGVWTDLSSSIPHGNAHNFDNFYAQGAYDLVVKVSPHDSNTVVIGGTNLYVSTDGFRSDSNTTQIGGYTPGTKFPDFQIYKTHHPDNHDMAFLPSDSNVLVSVNDGGIYRTENVYADTVEWTTLNNGYRSTQLYTVGFNPSTTDDILIGGFQDNGNFFTSSNDPESKWVLPLNGDGSYMGIADTGNIYYLSIQRGKIFRMKIDTNGSVEAFRRIDPIDADESDYNFINPLILDPNDNNLMYVAGGSRVWRNDSLSFIPMTNQYDSIGQAWFSYSDTVTTAQGRVSAIAVSKKPANIVYYGTSLGQVFKIVNAHTGDSSHQNITRIGGFGSFPTPYVNSIAIDPTDANKVLVAFSNYFVYSLYYTDDGGLNWKKVAGDFEKDIFGRAEGPSCRSVSILPRSDGKLYLVGTSVGLYATDTLIDNLTVWKQLEVDRIGNAIVEMVQTRTTDGLVAVATHGNGIYSTKIDKVQDIIVGTSEIPNLTREQLKIYPNPSSGKINIETESGVLDEKRLIQIRDISGKKVFATEAYTSNGRIQIDVEGISRGVYFLTIDDITTKLIINK